MVLALDDADEKQSESASKYASKSTAESVDEDVSAFFQAKEEFLRRKQQSKSVI